MIKDTFQIKDLENLTGIKIPTLRIWEKRYGILKPLRTETGIRYYNTEEVSKILSIVYLNRNGWKISKIAKLSENEIFQTVKNLDHEKQDYPPEVEDFLRVMFSFDSSKFNRLYKTLREKHSFKTVYEKYFYPLLLRIGILWQTNTIDVIHEHFISSLITQKLIYEIDNLGNLKSQKSKTYILFLPTNELHEIGLRYLQYNLLLQNKESIYLGNHIDIKYLDKFRNRKDIVLIGNITINPGQKSLLNYLDSLQEFSTYSDLPIYLYGLQFDIHTTANKIYNNVFLFNTAKELLASLS